MERNFCNFAKEAIRDHFMMIDNLLFEADKINDEKVLDKIRMELDEILPRIVQRLNNTERKQNNETNQR